jgi:hypothetical protein
MSAEDLSDIDIEFTMMSVIRSMFYTPVMAAITIFLFLVSLWIAIAIYLDRGDVIYLMLATLFMAVFILIIGRRWRSALRVQMEGQRVTMTAWRALDVEIIYGPRVRAEIRRNADNGPMDGLDGLIFEDGGKRIAIVHHPFVLEDIRRAWPDFVRVVTDHGMQRGPELANAMEMPGTEAGVPTNGPEA